MSTNPIPRAALDDRLAFVGVAGSGKTYAAGTAVERLLMSRARVVIIDPLDVWWGLRLTANGGAAAHPVAIFGGAHGDLALTENAGALIGEAVAGMAESCIVSLGALATKAAERRFMLAFLTALYRCAKGAPVHLVFDEADMWAPQQIRDRDGDAARLLGQMETIVRRGRVKGFIPWLITQRPAVLNKDVLSQADGLIAMKLTSSQDRAALGAWIEGQADKAEEKRILALLPQLERGSGVIWIPGRGVLTEGAFPAKLTFDSSSTPKRGERRASAPLQPLDVTSLKARLATVEEQVKANDPAALRAEVATLKRELAKKGAATAGDAALREQIHSLGAEIVATKREAAARGNALRVAGEEQCRVFLRRGIEAGALAVQEAIKNATMSVDAIARAEMKAWDKLGAFTIALPPDDEKAVGAAARGPAKEPGTPLSAAASAPRQFDPERARAEMPPIKRRDNGALGAERRPLAVLARYPAGMTEAQWAVAAGMKRTGGTWQAYKSRLRAAGAIVVDDGLWRITDDGLLSVNANIEPMPAPGEALVAFWAERVDGVGPMLRALAYVYPRFVTREALAEQLSMAASGGTFQTYLSRLRSAELIDEQKGIGLRAAPALMGASP